MKRTTLLLSLCATLALSPGLRAEEGVFQASLVPDVAIYPSTTRIRGFAINLWGMNEQNALAIGLINGSYGDSGGLSISVFNYAGAYSGTQLGAINLASAELYGAQIGAINHVSEVCSGLQIGVYNYAGRLSGLQLGVFNMAAQADHGMQIGLINLLPENRRWFSAGLANEIAPVTILVNWRH
jgi:hypothetical protein